MDGGERMLKGLTALSLAALLLAGCNDPQSEGREYPEYEFVEEYIQYGDYKAKEQEDGDGTRVLLWTDEDGEPGYKTILVKETNRLKIIDVKTEEVLFNNVVKMP